MIVVMEKGATPEQIDHMAQRVEGLGLKAHIIHGTERTVIAASPEWLRPLVGVAPASGHFLHFVAFEIGRGPDGTWWVLADRTQAPSGAGFGAARSSSCCSRSSSASASAATRSRGRTRRSSGRPWSNTGRGRSRRPSPRRASSPSPRTSRTRSIRRRPSFHRSGFRLRHRSLQHRCPRCRHCRRWGQRRRRGRCAGSAARRHAHPCGQHADRLRGGALQPLLRCVARLGTDLRKDDLCWIQV